MRPTDVCFPTHSLRAPAPRALPRAVERSRRGRRFTTPRLASAGERTIGAGRSLPRIGPLHRASDAPVAPLVRPAASSRSADLLSRRQDRVGHAPRERRMASTTRSTFRRWVTSSSRLSRNRFRPRETEPAFCRSRDFAITTRRSTLLRCTRSPRGDLAATLSLRLFARPRLRESSFGLGRVRLTLLWARRRQSTSATLTTREHTGRAFDHRPRRRPRSHSRCCSSTRTRTP